MRYSGTQGAAAWEPLMGEKVSPGGGAYTPLHSDVAALHCKSLSLRRPIRCLSACVQGQLTIGVGAGFLRPIWNHPAEWPSTRKKRNTCRAPLHGGKFGHFSTAVLLDPCQHSSNWLLIDCPCSYSCCRHNDRSDDIRETSPILMCGHPFSSLSRV
ncbi:hypothetical protein BJY00DRAFT_10628 [Aspergillus carlsbadensis]|nr:hypothetical protein BJY00DRAFT_10628 [Aspergillus carlsbadensis]